MWLHRAGDVRLNTFISEAGVCTVRGRHISSNEFLQAALESLQVNGIPPNPMGLLQAMSACASSPPRRRAPNQPPSRSNYYTSPERSTTTNQLAIQ
jgi:hypothetical protein